MKGKLSKAQLKIIKDPAIKKIFLAETENHDIKVDKKQYKKERIKDADAALDTSRKIMSPLYTLQGLLKPNQTVSEYLGYELNLSLTKNNYMQNQHNSAIIEQGIIGKGADINLHDIFYLFKGGTYLIFDYKDTVENYFEKIRKKISVQKKVFGNYYLRKERQIPGKSYSLFIGSLGDPSTSSGMSYWAFGANLCLVGIPDNNSSHCILFVELRAGRALYKIISQNNIKKKLKKYLTEFK